LWSGGLALAKVNPSAPGTPIGASTHIRRFTMQSNDEVRPITDEQLEAINRSMSLIDGEPTTEQLEAILRSLMLPAA
jgi:hypothetical protein